MLKTTVKKVVREVTETTTIEYCDKCEGIIEDINDCDTYGIEEASFKIESGEAYPESKFTNGFKLDLCKNCAEEARQLLEENGFKFQEINN